MKTFLSRIKEDRARKKKYQKNDGVIGLHIGIDKIIIYDLEKQIIEVNFYHKKGQIKVQEKILDIIEHTNFKDKCLTIGLKYIIDEPPAPKEKH